MYVYLLDSRFGGSGGGGMMKVMVVDLNNVLEDQCLRFCLFQILV